MNLFRSVLPVTSRTFLSRSQYFTVFAQTRYSTSTANDFKKLIQTDLKQSMRSKDTFQTQVLKSLLSDITYAEKSIPTTASAKQLTPSFYISILRTSISKREESIRLFKEANRTELVEKEQKEADILAKYLPTQMADEEVEQVVRGVMKELGVEKGHGKKEMGKVMRECAKLLDETRVSKKKVADIVGKLLM